MDDLTSNEVKQDPDVENFLFVDIHCSVMVGDNNLQEATIAGEVCVRVWDVDDLTSHEVEPDPDVEKYLFVDVCCNLMVGVPELW